MRFLQHEEHWEKVPPFLDELLALCSFVFNSQCLFISPQQFANTNLYFSFRRKAHYGLGVLPKNRTLYLLTSKSDWHLKLSVLTVLRRFDIPIHPIQTTAESNTRIEECFPSKELLDCLSNSPLMHHRNCIENSFEKMGTHVRLQEVNGLGQGLNPALMFSLPA